MSFVRLCLVKPNSTVSCNQNQTGHPPPHLLVTKPSSETEKDSIHHRFVLAENIMWRYLSRVYHVEKSILLTHKYDSVGLGTEPKGEGSEQTQRVTGSNDKLGLVWLSSIPHFHNLLVCNVCSSPRWHSCVWNRRRRWRGCAMHCMACAMPCLSWEQKR